MLATCVPQYVPRANTGLSKHGDPVFPHFWSWNQNLARVCARGGGGYMDKHGVDRTTTRQHPTVRVFVVFSVEVSDVELCCVCMRQHVNMELFAVNKVQ